ncbi:hypothetical protein Clacol_008742 [Clathrus columnatus]|uniref:Uncharacterized protein n=1 Tax=Clathrus columnatus TaxID=1419009 RepID=A0AAV5ALW6_9AGAM|nr:hypothetical protein Clacol_008742 [Clathrus columnatus]
MDTSGQVIGSLPFIKVQGSFAALDLIRDIAIILSDMLAVIAVVYQVWGVWKLKRSAGLQSTEDLVTLLLRQGISRFFLRRQEDLFVAAILGTLQNVLSSLLICEFTLDLRQRNAKRSVTNPSGLNLPTISFQGNSVRTVLTRLHGTIVAEMGEMIELVDIDDQGSGVPDPSNNVNLGLQYFSLKFNNQITIHKAIKMRIKQAMIMINLSAFLNASVIRYP